MINYKYDFELYTLNELPTNDARLFLNIIVSNALTKAILKANKYLKKQLLVE